MPLPPRRRSQSLVGRWMTTRASVRARAMDDDEASAAAAASHGGQVSNRGLRANVTADNYSSSPLAISPLCVKPRNPPVQSLCTPCMPPLSPVTTTPPSLAAGSKHVGLFTPLSLCKLLCLFFLVFDLQIKPQPMYISAGHICKNQRRLTLHRAHRRREENMHA